GSLPTGGAASGGGALSLTPMASGGAGASTAGIPASGIAPVSGLLGPSVGEGATPPVSMGAAASATGAGGTRPASSCSSIVALVAPALMCTVRAAAAAIWVVPAKPRALTVASPLAPLGRYTPACKTPLAAADQ